MTKKSVATRLFDSFVFIDKMYDEDINADVAVDIAVELDTDVTAE